MENCFTWLSRARGHHSLRLPTNVKSRLDPRRVQNWLLFELGSFCSFKNVPTHPLRRVGMEKIHLGGGGGGGGRIGRCIIQRFICAEMAGTTWPKRKALCFSMWIPTWLTRGEHTGETLHNVRPLHAIRHSKVWKKEKSGLEDYTRHLNITPLLNNTNRTK